MRQLQQIWLAPMFLILPVFSMLTGCASAVPSNFQYQTSLRGEQGLPGRSERLASAEDLLMKSGSQDPQKVLKAAFPEAEVKIKRWGLTYFGKDWERYQVVLDADIKRGDDKVKCRGVSSETPVGAPTLNELLSNDGAEFSRNVKILIAACIVNAGGV